jgi:hypothetical protein
MPESRPVDRDTEAPLADKILRYANLLDGVDPNTCLSPLGIARRLRDLVREAQL